VGLVVNARANNTPDEYLARESIFFEEGFENGDNHDYFDAVVDGTLIACKSAGNDYYATTDGTIASIVAKDAYNLVLNYYNNDYKAIDFPSPSLNISTQLGSDFRPLYNGNISSMGVNIDKLQNPLLYNYQYDQLNRLVKMDAWQSSGTNWASLNKLSDFKEDISYDPNGNILTYNRNGNSTFAGKPLAMDNLTYNYKPNSNKLDSIGDNPANTSNYTEDIDNQTAGNYDYDAIGNLTKDNAEGITNIEWTVYGKISKITKNDGSVINYTYDASGNRISKAVTKNSITITTWYVRDASGNVMSVYEAGDVAVNSGHLTQSEVDLYGSSRLGIKKDSIDMQNIPSYEIATLSDGSKAYNYIFTRGKKFFELSNHLGNVLVTVSDKKLRINDSNDNTTDYYVADVMGANDYYPFGMIMPGRSYTAGNGYRYGFNGKEMDNEVKGTGNQQDYGMRIYDPRVGRFLSVDPISQSYPMLTPYQFASNTPIQAIDLDGLEKYYVTYQPHDGKDNIIKIETDNSLKYFSVSVNGIPIKPKVVEFIKIDEYGKQISRSGDIPLKNYGSTLYVGPFNPKYESGAKKGKDRYDYPAINSLDQAGKNHDRGYDDERARGPLDAVYLLRTLALDKQLVKDAQNVVDMYKNNKIDPVTNEPVSDETVAAAKGVVSIFSKIVKEKTIRLAIVNATNAVIDKTKEVIDKTKDAANDFSRDLNNSVPLPHQ